MPLDILFEIFAHLTPLDILRLARTTKSLRNILMRRSAISVWKAAQENVPELPDCPSDMTEPQYANLIFGTNCHYCLTPGVANVIWVYRVRCCMKCLNLHFTDGTESVLFPQIPCPPYSSIPTYLCKIKGRCRIVFSKAYIGELHAKITEVNEDEAKLEDVLNEAKQFVQQRSQERNLLSSWYEGCKVNRSEALDAARKRRRDAIMDRLKALDPSWGNEINLLDSVDRRNFFNHPFVKQPKDLTDRIWVNIRGTITGILEKLKEGRLKREKAAELRLRKQLFTTFVEKYIKSRPYDEILPRPVDFYFVEGAHAIRAFIETDPFGEIGSDSLEQFKDLLPHLAEEWKMSSTAQLLDLLRTDYGYGHDKDTPVDESILSLATTWFFCRGCHEPIPFPRVLSHYCLSLGFDEIAAAFGNTPWSVSRLRPFGSKKEGYEIAKSVVEACGYDTSTTTSAFMDEVDPIFECRTCGGESRTVMPWKTAVCHPYYLGVRHIVSTVLSDVEEIAVARSKLANRNRRRVCNHCRHETSDVSVMEHHIRREHGIDAGLSSEHCIPHKDDPMRCAMVTL